MPSTGFADEYTLCRETLEGQDFGGALPGLLDLTKALGAEGPELNFYGKVAHFREVTLKFKEADKIMEASGIPATGLAKDDAVKMAAGLKLLRHLYLAGARGSQQVWVVSTPSSYAKFASDELLDVKADATKIKAKLADVTEQFSEETKDHLAEAMQLGLSWCESAKIVLGAAATTPASRAIVERWFAASDTPATDLDKTIAALLAGFKKIAFALNHNLVVITDMPLYRSDATKNTVEAFVRRRDGKHERPRTIYIEKALFENYDVSVLHDMKKNWARVLVHECTHTEVATQDNGYAYRGIGPGTKITADKAANNADSWAFFAADCAGALTDGERLRALGGTGGKLTKLAKNWN
jgi:hypothetical protein